MPDDFEAVAVAVDDELVLEVAIAVVNEVVVEAAAAEFATVVLTDAVPVVVADAALGPAYLVQKPNASLLIAVRRENRYG